jgi:uncharacterized protein
VNASRAAWREPMVWLMLAIPFATVVAGMSTLRVAHADDMDAEPDEVRRTAQAQVVDLDADRHAAALGLHANVRVDAQGQPELAMPLPGALELRLVHPTRADGDLRWTRALDGTWSGPVVPAHARGRWVLEDAAHAWRLVGRWPSDTGVAGLQPAVAAR